MLLLQLRLFLLLLKLPQSQELLQSRGAMTRRTLGLEFIKDVVEWERVGEPVDPSHVAYILHACDGALTPAELRQVLLRLPGSWFL